MSMIGWYSRNSSSPTSARSSAERSSRRRLIGSSIPRSKTWIRPLPNDFAAYIAVSASRSSSSAVSAVTAAVAGLPPSAIPMLALSVAV